MQAYVVKARSKLGNLPTSKDYDNLINENDNDRKMEAIRKLYPGFENIQTKNGFELAMDEFKASTIKSLSYFLRGRDREFFEDYTSIYRLIALQKLCQAILNKSLQNNFSAFSDDPFLPEKINRDMTFEDLVKSMKNTSYHRTLQPFLGETMPRNSMIFLISNSLTKFYFRSLIDCGGRYPDPLKKTILSYLGGLIDLTNLEILYRLLAFFDLKPPEIFNYLIEGGRYYKSDRLKELSILSREDFLREMAKGPYRDGFFNENEIDKGLMEERYSLNESLKNRDDVLFLVYTVNKVDFAQKNITSLLEMDESVRMEERANFLLTR